MKYLPLVCLLCWSVSVHGQLPTPDCRIAFDEVDPFDSLRTIGSETVSMGYLIPSRYELVDGPKLVEEAKAIMIYSENDSISGFFLNFVLPEYELEPITNGMNVKLLLADSTVIGLYDIPDEGYFDRSINMRVYQHTCPLPLDYFYKLAFIRVAAIRVEYQKRYHIVQLSEEQGAALQKAIQCVGLRSGLYPIEP
ncbi:MAG: hypothetical protein KDC54_24150 [Lewinella sp.]|nr:hypothetical protein [Lewinella sp.]